MAYTDLRAALVRLYPLLPPAAITEAVEVLMERLPAAKVARLLFSWQIGQGDYLKMRDELFAGETVDSLYEKAKTRNGSK
jgi:hypothetical protein